MPTALPPAVRRRRWFAVVAAVAAAVPLVGTASPAEAQLRAMRGRRFFPGMGVPEQPADTDAPAGVTVPGSPGAVEALARAADKQQQKQWKTAADFYREAIAKYPGRVVPVEVDPKTATYRYAGVAAVAQDRIAKWPPEGLAAYRAAYGPAAADRLASAGRGDWAVLSGVFNDDFVTDAGKTAGLRLVDAYAEAGDFAAAVGVGNRLLDVYPNLGVDRPTVLFRTALAAHWGGDDATAHRRADELRQADPKATGTVGGRDVPLLDTLTAALATPAPRPAADPAAADTYPSFGGVGGRGDVSPSVARPGASLATVHLNPPDWSGVPKDRLQAVRDGDDASVKAGQAGGVIPAVDAGDLFFQDGRTVYAVDVNTGRPLPGWAATYPAPGDTSAAAAAAATASATVDGVGPAPAVVPEPAGRFHLPTVAGRARGEQLTITVTPRAVLAVMGQPDRLLPTLAGTVVPQQFNGFNQVAPDAPPSPVRLVCLDRTTGRELWKVGPTDLPESTGAARAGEFVGTPLAVPAAVAGTPDDAVLVVARGGRDFQFDDCYVVCLSARTGQFRWSTFCGSGTRGSAGGGGGDPSAPQDPSQLALADGRVYVMSNLGTVAALDPADGRIDWLTGYVRDAMPTAEQLQMQMNGDNSGGNPGGSNRPWSPNPCLVQGGHVFVLPTDAKSLLVFDAATGRRVKQVPTDDVDHADVLLGIHDGYAVLTGGRVIYGVDWRRFSHDDPTRARWQETPFGSDNETNSPATAIAGRGFLSAEGLYVVNGLNLSDVSWRTHKIVVTYPNHGTFTDGQGPGNVLASSQNVIVAGADRVDVYTDLGVVAARYQREVTAGPADPDPRLRYAAALFAAGQTDAALGKVDQAMALLGGRDHLRSGPSRQLLFETLLDFARRTAVAIGTAAADPQAAQPDSHASTGLALANAIYDRAAAAADAPADRVTYLLARAKFDHDTAHADAAAVALAQQVLGDAALRHVPITDELTAGAAAQAAITASVAVDAGAYAPVEARADAALADARTKDDPDVLLGVAEVYPNSRAAADARQGAVDLLQSHGQTARAIDVLRQTYVATADPAARAAVLQQIATDLLATGPAGVGPAADRLAWAAHLAPDRPLAADLKLPDGSVLKAGDSSTTYATAVDALRKTLAAQATARLPDFRLASPTAAVAVYRAANRGAQPDSGNGSYASPFAGPVAFIPDVNRVVHPPHAFARPDRVITWSPPAPGGAGGLSVYAVGQTTPRFRIADMAEPPVGAVWAGDVLYAWTPQRAYAVDDVDGRSAWPAAVAVASLSDLPPVATAAGSVTDDAPPAPAEPDDGNVRPQVMPNGQIMNVRVAAGGRFIIRNGKRRPGFGPQRAGPGEPPAAAGQRPDRPGRPRRADRRRPAGRPGRGRAGGDHDPRPGHRPRRPHGDRPLAEPPRGPRRRRRAGQRPLRRRPPERRRRVDARRL